MTTKPETLDQFNHRITDEIFGPTKGVGLYDPVPDYVLNTDLFGPKAVTDEKVGSDETESDEG